MALNTEIWVREIVEDFFPDNSFVSRSVDHSIYVNNHTVHVPQSGKAPTVTKNRSDFPAEIKTRIDGDLNYTLDIFDVEPMRVQNLSDVELSYDKRQSVIGQSKRALQNAVFMEILKKWIPSGCTTVTTTGEGETAHVNATSTGMRKAMTRAEVEKIKKIFDGDDVPVSGRTILLDAVMYNQLVNSLTQAESVNFLAGADPVTGVMGKFLGFDFMMRSSVLQTAAGGSLKTGAAAATDCAAGLAWQRDSVSRAIGQVVAFEREKDPTYYGDIFSFGVRAGGACLRSDNKGIVLLYQGTPA